MIGGLFQTHQKRDQSAGVEFDGFLGAARLRRHFGPEKQPSIVGFQTPGFEILGEDDLSEGDFDESILRYCILSD